MYSLSILNGDFEIDSRGRPVITTGRAKVAQEVNYMLRTSLILPTIMGSAASNVIAIKDAINEAVNTLISMHALNPSLPNNERVQQIANLQVNSATPTSYSFSLDVSTYAGDNFTLNLGSS